MPSKQLIQTVAEAVDRFPSVTNYLLNSATGVPTKTVQCAIQVEDVLLEVYVNRDDTSGLVNIDVSRWSGYGVNASSWYRKHLKAFVENAELSFGAQFPMKHSLDHASFTVTTDDVPKVLRMVVEKEVEMQLEAIERAKESK